MIYAAIDDRQGAYLVSADGASQRLLPGVNSRSVFVEPNLLVFARGSQVLAQRVNLASATLVGEPVELADGVARDQRTGNAGFAATGELLVVAQQEVRAHMQWFDAATGRPGQVLGEPGDLARPRISPQGDRVVVAIAESSGGAEDLWIFDLERKVGTRITHTTATEVMPVWSPDGRRIAYATDVDGPPDIVIREADAGSIETVLVAWDDPLFATDWLPDGSAVVFHNYPAIDIFLAPVDGSPPETWLEAPGAQHYTRASPDGRWLAFRSTELGTAEIFAAPVADSGRRIRISTTGGRNVAWAPDGRSLLYSDENTVYEVEIDTEAYRVLGEPRTVLAVDAPDRITGIDVTPAGDQLLLTIRDASLQRPNMLVHVGWRRSLPAGV